MIITSLEELLCQDIDPEEFLYPPEEYIPPDNNERRD